MDLEEMISSDIELEIKHLKILENPKVILYFNFNLTSASEFGKFLKKIVNPTGFTGHSARSGSKVIWSIDYSNSKISLCINSREKERKITWTEFAKHVIRMMKEEKSVSETKETKVIVSEDYTRAVTLDKRIKANSRAMEDSLWEICKGLKEMRDGKLYKELGYQNMADYSENEVGIGRKQSERYIKIAETYSEENATSMSHLGTTKLFLLTKLDEPLREEFIQTNDVNNTSTRELEEKIKEINDLKAENEKMQEYTKQLAEKINSVESDKDAAINEKQALSGVLSTVKADKNRLLEQNEQLLAKVKELEERPVDVTVATSDNSEEIEKIREELREEYEDQLATMNGELIANKRMVRENSAAAHEALKEVEELKKQLAEKPKEIEVTDYDAMFDLYLSNITEAKCRLKAFTMRHEEFKKAAYMWALKMMEEFKE